ncbi:MAG: hypothetical protein IPJ75_13075 [Ignavibacteriales bacterium]|nr:hypothetical protein [Ignavibacteriales bacterium]
MAILNSNRVIGNYSQRAIFVVISILFSLLFVSCKDETGVGSPTTNYSDQVKKVLEVALDSIKKADVEFPGGLLFR